MSYFQMKDNNKEETKMAGFQLMARRTHSESVSFCAVTCVGETEAQRQGNKRDRVPKSTNSEHTMMNTWKKTRSICWESFCRYVGSTEFSECHQSEKKSIHEVLRGISDQTQRGRKNKMKMKMKNILICPLMKASSLGNSVCSPDHGHFLIGLMLAYLMMEAFTSEDARS